MPTTEIKTVIFIQEVKRFFFRTSYIVECSECGTIYERKFEGEAVKLSEKHLSERHGIEL